MQKQPPGHSVMPDVAAGQHMASRNAGWDPTVCPHPCCACSRVRPGLFLGCRCCEQSMTKIKQSGITHVLQVGTGLMPSHPGSLSYCTILIHDSSDTDIVSCFPTALAFIQSSLQSGGHVLVHCHAGVSRSATVMAAYLMWSESLSSAQALAAVGAARPCVNPNPGFQQQLHHWELLGCGAFAWPGWQQVRRQTLEEELGVAAAAAGVASFGELGAGLAALLGLDLDLPPTRGKAACHQLQEPWQLSL